LTTRYALYYAPASDSPLWRFGSATLGYDAVTGADVAFAVPSGCDPNAWPALTDEPRRYGFHATLKAPFELAAGRSEGQLRAFAHNYAAGLDGVRLAGLSVAALGSFVALTSSVESDALQRFAFALVQAFEPFRAPLSPADIERRLRHPLTPAQRAYLEAFGYPYVGDAFRFHMTLTGSLPADRVGPVKRALSEAYALAVPAGTVTLDRIALFKQESRESRFRLLDSFALNAYADAG
jgi:putative phosphonate metabolism protein